MRDVETGDWPRSYPYGMALYHCHPSRCSKPGCKAQLREVLVETKHANLGSVQVSSAVARDRVRNPKDHAGAFAAWGPGFGDGEDSAEKMSVRKLYR